MKRSPFIFAIVLTLLVAAIPFAADWLKDFPRFSRLGRDVDVVSGITNNTSYVRNDEILTYNNTYTSSEWTAFVNDNLDPYRDLVAGGPERHPHDPLLSEIENANVTSNMRIGVHNVNPTNRTSNNWDNGFPDRTRRVIIQENFNTSSKLSARQLTVNNNSISTILSGINMMPIIFFSKNKSILAIPMRRMLLTHTA